MEEKKNKMKEKKTKEMNRKVIIDKTVWEVEVFLLFDQLYSL